LAVSEARYDGIAEWYDAFVRGQGAAWTWAAEQLIRELLGSGPGRCLDLGCGGGAFIPTLADLGWTVVGTDLSAEQLEMASSRVGGLVEELVQADARRLPSEEGSFDAVVAALVYTDIDGYELAVREAARVLRPGGRFVHVGTHPCFVSPVARTTGEGTLRLFPGYHERRLVFDSPAYMRGSEGLRARVGAWQVPLAELLNAVTDSGLRLERALESPEDPPGLLALRAVRDG
jgi:ubiquinone/menaquinone biosynthesis C-methylase UbiE